MASAKTKKKKTNTHGGKRDGAGRKCAHPEGHVRSVGVTMPKNILDSLDVLWIQRGEHSRSALITKIVREYMAKNL